MLKTTVAVSLLIDFLTSNILIMSTGNFWFFCSKNSYKYVRIDIIYILIKSKYLGCTYFSKLLYEIFSNFI